MTGDVEEECPFPMDACSPSAAAFVNSNMAVEDSCVYTATIPTELVGNFPEGSVLQIMPDSTIVAVAVENVPASDENSVVFKNSTFPIENGQSSLNLPNILDASESNPPSQAVDLSVCPEENMDIDLSFLNEAVSTMMPDSKCLSRNAAELQSMIVDASSQSLNLLQNNLPIEKAKCIEESASSSETSKDTVDPSNVVMIDVSKPIQLSQNSLIMVNGQKCVLQHNVQTGQVVAYPVKKQETSQKKRGRPRKTSLEQTQKETGDRPPVTEMESVSEEEREKGLLEVLNDDGALVRRSSRKRKKAKVLRDYETGNLKLELGSDAEDAESLDKDAESYTHRKKAKGPGRPRKSTKESQTDPNSDAKRQRGRPKKLASAGEATQAFLVQTADGQALMMQVPLSSIPPGISLQEMAQEIANKLNLGLNQGNDTVGSEVKGLVSESASEISKITVQDHSVGSTTPFPGLELNDATVEEDGMQQTVCETEEIVVLESDNCVKEVAPSNSHLNNAELHENNPPLDLPSTVSTGCSPSVYAHFDHDFCLPTSSSVEILKNGAEPKENSAQFNKSDFVKSEDSIKLVLSGKCDINIPIQDFLNKNSNSENPSELVQPFDETSVTIKPTSTIRETISDCVPLGKGVQSILKNNVCRESEFSSVSETVQVSPQFVVTDVLNSESQVLLSSEKTSSSFETGGSNDVTSTTVTEALPVHLSEKDVNEVKHCKICQMPYLKEEEIVDHFKVKHPKCICLECNYMNEHPYVIKRHAFRHTNHGCVCKICNKKYKDMYILKMHIKMVHLPPEVLYACEICDKKFTRKAHLKRHLRIHAPVKQYQCPHCEYKGCEKSDITKHLLIHDEPKFKCEICGKAFRHLKNKDLHLKRHSGQRDYKCAACGFFGYTFTDIRKHIERRHSVSCPQCKQVFTDNELLKDHKRTGSCQMEPNSDVKVLKNSNITIVNGEATLLDEMPLDILDPSQVLTIGECSEETLSALQSGQLVMTSMGGILNTHNGHLIVEGLEDNNNVITSDNLSVLSLEKDTSEKTITVVTTQSIPLRNCSLENVLASGETITEPFVISAETEVTTEKSSLVLG